MFDLIAVWFAAGMFVAGGWIIVGAFRPAPAGRRGMDRAGPRGRDGHRATPRP